MTAKIDQFAVADARAQIAEEALSLSASLNVHRAVLSLIALFRPRLADWATLVISDSVSGSLVLFGGNNANFSTVVARNTAAELDLDHVEIELAAAGHPGPIVLRADGRVEQVEVTGTAIGLLPDARYDAAVVVLNHGDAILMFNDGVDGARGDDGYYGVARLMAFLPAYAGASPEVICKAAEQDVVEYLDGRSHDDIALLAITCGA